MPPYRLLMTARSPFSRRVLLALRRLELSFEVETTEPAQAAPTFLAANPLGMIPVLITPESVAVPDSTLILEYLNQRHGRIWPEGAEAGLPSRKASTLATGVMEAAVDRLSERLRPESLRSAEVLGEHRDTIFRTLQALDTGFDWSALAEQSRTDLGIALEYLEFRHPELAWREAAPGLAPILEELRKDPRFAETRPRQ